MALNDEVGPNGVTYRVRPDGSVASYERDGSEGRNRWKAYRWSAHPLRGRARRLDALCVNATPAKLFDVLAAWWRE